MTRNELLRQLLIDEEGIDLNAHQVQGVWHIGIGHNLEIDQTDEELDVLGISFVAYVESGSDDPSGLKITEQQAFDLFDVDVDDAKEDLYPAFTDDELDALNDARCAVIISMAFQLGGGGIRKFKNFIKAVKAEDWERAADEMVYANVDAGRKSAWV